MVLQLTDNILFQDMKRIIIFTFPVYNFIVTFLVKEK